MRLCRSPRVAAGLGAIVLILLGSVLYSNFSAGSLAGVAVVVNEGGALNERPTEPPRGRKETAAATTAAATVPATSDAYTDDDDLQLPLFGRPQTTLECVCGPDNIPVGAENTAPGRLPRSCAPVFRNAVVHVVPGKSVRFHIFANTMRDVRRVIGAFSNCIHWEVAGQQRFFWPTDAKFEVEMVNGDQAAAMACDRPDQPRPLHPASQRFASDQSVNVTWHVARWFGLSPFHHTFDRGALQMFMQRAALNASWARVLGVPGADPMELPHAFWATSNVNDVEYASTRPWMSRTSGHAHLHPVHEIFELMSGTDRYDWHRDGFVCSPLQGMGYWYLSPMTYAVNYTTVVEPTWPWIREASLNLQRRFVATYGDVPERDIRTSEILYDMRPTADFDGQQRARGIQPALVDEFVKAFSLAAERPISLRRVRFHEGMPLGEQGHLLRTHRLVLTGEGAITVLATLARPGTTWVMVYNHTRPFGEWRHSTFHAGVGRGLGNVRLLIYVVSHGRRAPAQTLAAAAMAPFAPGVTFIGDVDQNGADLSPPPTTAAPSLSPDPKDG